MYIAIIKKAELSWNFLSVKNSLNMMNNLLLTEREGHTGEYWPEVVAVRTERSALHLKNDRGPIFTSTARASLVS